MGGHQVSLGRGHRGDFVSRLRAVWEGNMSDRIGWGMEAGVRRRLLEEEHFRVRLKPGAGVCWEDPSFDS